MPPAGQAEDIVAVAEDCVALETAMARRIRAGEPASRVLSASHEEMLNRRKDSFWPTHRATVVVSSEL